HTVAQGRCDILTTGRSDSDSGWVGDDIPTLRPEFPTCIACNDQAMGRSGDDDNNTWPSTTRLRQASRGGPGYWAQPAGRQCCAAFCDAERDGKVLVSVDCGLVWWRQR
ncbi:7419_t:CDS:2, partial [Scutellospora calospora]